ncbi:hypothetical protein BCR33DRAFT_784459 [Rhizoclosmatium globosum]|uniref:C2H2-type domain-containing protein n=1 Tax=Rhizoclosmatium globosum TaxID=329046 RepID=A0A1Y2CHC7_9FUNG|nr:hypothetical protein BCR33DRAFT_784459 [Rhizoclosmatium globosum]|eukprot:ORY45725.1 hypothetical protein BCR33DRAFT_784459 [Rhizoclosmatium globosum]
MSPLPPVWNLIRASVLHNGPTLPSIRNQLTDHEKRYEELVATTHSYPTWTEFERTTLPSPPLAPASNACTTPPLEVSASYSPQQLHISASPVIMPVSSHYQLCSQNVVVRFQHQRHQSRRNHTPYDRSISNSPHPRTLIVPPLVPSSEPQLPRSSHAQCMTSAYSRYDAISQASEVSLGQPERVHSIHQLVTPHPSPPTTIQPPTPTTVFLKEPLEIPPPISCKICKIKFSRSNDLHRHNQTRHSGIKKHKCDQCGLLFSRSDSLKRHTRKFCTGITTKLE